MTVLSKPKCTSKICTYCNASNSFFRSFTCSCYRFNTKKYGTFDVIDEVEDGIECVGLIIGAVVVGGIVVLVGNELLTVLFEIPTLLSLPVQITNLFFSITNFLKNIIDLVYEMLMSTANFVELSSEFFANFEFLGVSLLKLFGPIGNLIKWIVTKYYDVVEFIIDMFPDLNRNLLDILFIEIAAILGIKTFKEFGEKADSFKKSPGGKFYRFVDTPIRIIKKELKNYKFFDLLFKLIVLPIESTFFSIGIIIDALALFF